MPTIAEVRSKFPQYNDLSDDQLADGLHQKFYSDMPRDEFDKKIGYTAATTDPETTSPGFLGTIKDAAQSLPRGIMGGISETLSATGQSVGPEAGLDPASLPGKEQTRQILEQNVTGELYKPQTGLGRGVESAGEWLGNPTSYVGGGVVGNAAKAALTGFGSEMIGQVGDKFGVGGAARFGGALASGKVAELPSKVSSAVRGTKAAASEIPTADKLFEAAEAGYNSPTVKGSHIASGAMPQLKSNIAAKLEAANFDPIRAEGVHKYLDFYFDKKLGNGAVSFEKLNNVRNAFRDFTKGPEKAAASIVDNEITNFIDSLTAQHVVSGNPSQALKDVKNANANHRAASTIEDIQGKVQQALTDAATTGLKGNVYNKLRQAANNIQKNKQISKFLKPEEIAELDKISRGGNIGHLLNIIAKAGPEHPLSGWASAVATDIAGGSGLAIAQLAAGKIAQDIAPKIVLREFERLENKIAAASPAGGGRVMETPSTMEQVGAGLSSQAAKTLRSTAPLAQSQDQPQ